jgi:hypothetical protein
MKKTTLLISQLLFVLLFAACAAQTFDGSKTGNDTQFITSYRLLNTTLTHEMELSSGDVVAVGIVSDSGRVDVLVADEDGGVIYQGDDAPSSSFKLEIAKDGKYTFSVTGKKARGGVSFAVEKD